MTPASLKTFFNRFERNLRRHMPRRVSRFSLPAIPSPAAGLLAGVLAEESAARLTLLLAPAPLPAERLAADLETLRGHAVELLHFPAVDESESLISSGRLAAVNALLAPRTKPCVLIASLHALLQPVPSPKALQRAALAFRREADTPFATLAERLSALGYTRAEMVEEPLSFALRGGILDIWALGEESPVRLEFFGDTVESLRTFDPRTQCSVKPCASLTVQPGPGTALETVMLSDLLPQELARIDYDHALIETALDQFQDRRAAKKLIAALDAKSSRVCIVGEPPPPGVGLLPIDIAGIPGVRDLGGETALHPELYARTRSQLLLQLDESARGGDRVIIGADNAAAVELILRELPPDTPVDCRVLPVSEGFTDSAAKIRLVAQSDLYPSRRAWQARPRRTSAPAGQRLEYALDVEPGELVVHIEHGIGRFAGLTELLLDGKKTEVFTVEYAEGTRLHVPTSHAHLLSRYIGASASHVKLHSLNGKRWLKEKLDAERGVADLAASLLETQARRSVRPGFAFNTQAHWIAEFEAMFPYQETPDQLRVMEEIKADMGRPAAMDRLICGDAGYGKTEMAMRAAFIAVMNGKQVALLAPTTVLAEQHFETFSDRMASFPVRIDVLSRFRTTAQRAKTRQDAASGAIDILIGTHALLSENLPFKDLGLLVIDEEQRFGVTHKEKIKQIRNLIDVLTLSATPIPRTLYLSLTGARDMSLLQTPPKERVAVETRIHRDSDAILTTAIQQELNRGGQVYYLYNRVMTAGHIHRRVARLIPRARIALAHGQMPARDLAAVMQRFEHGEIDILICTTIIESGIDIPRANTILIDRADRFGLADLYQLRGRVGRSIVKGFAYLLLPEHGAVDPDARRRMEALKKHSGLGAGYNLALRDLEIRGAGNLLGSAQSGHIAAIGFGLYCQLLRRTVARMKGEKPPTLVDVALNLDFITLSPGDATPNAACIPYSYIEDELQRMSLHRRIAEAVAINEIAALRKELADRYGKPPPPVTRFLALSELRIQAARARISRIETKENRIFLYNARTQAPLTVNGKLPRLAGATPDRKIAALAATVNDALKQFANENS